MKKFYNSKLLFIILFGFLFNVNILFANQVDVTFENGDRYIGEVLNNKKHGSGTYVESGPDGKEYKGEWKNDKQHGKGFLKQSGMEYTGDFFEGKIQGKGVLVNKDGKYEGEFLNGMMHGIGVLKLNDGRIVRGEFKNNKYVGVSKKVANPATSMSSDSPKMEEKKKLEYQEKVEQENTKKSKEPDIPVEKRSGLNMFDEEEAELSMRCWNPHELNTIIFEKIGSTIWRRVNDGRREMPAKIIESDDNVKKYYAPVTTLLYGKFDVVLDFKKKIMQQKSAITGTIRLTCK